MNSINLLPQNLKEQYESSKKNRVLRNLLLGTIFVSITMVGILVVGNAFLSIRYKAVVDELKEKEESVKDHGTLESDAAALNERLEAAKKVIDKKVFFSSALGQIWQSMPEQVYIQQIEMDTDTATRGKIIGSAENKSVIANFLLLLEDSDEFEYVDLEITQRTTDAFLGVEKENFTISFVLNLKELNEKS